MVGETHFLRYLPEPHDASLLPPEEIKRHVLCSGMLHTVPFFGFHLTDSQDKYTLPLLKRARKEVSGILPLVVLSSFRHSLMSWSLHTSTSIQTPAFFGVKRSLWTMVLGAMLAHGYTLLPVRQNTTKGNTLYMQDVIRRVPLLLVARQVFFSEVLALGCWSVVLYVFSYSTRRKLRPSSMKPLICRARLC